MVLAALTFLALDLAAWAMPNITCEKILPKLPGLEDLIQSRCSALEAGRITVEEAKSWGSCANTFLFENRKLRVPPAELEKVVQGLCEQASLREEWKDQELPVSACLEQLRDKEAVGFETAAYLCFDRANRESLAALRSCIQTVSSKKDVLQGGSKNLTPQESKDIIATACTYPDFRSQKKSERLATCLRRLDAIRPAGSTSSFLFSTAATLCPIVSMSTPDSDLEVKAFISCIHVANQYSNHWAFFMAHSCASSKDRPIASCAHELNQLSKLNAAFEQLTYPQASDFCSQSRLSPKKPELRTCAQEMSSLLPQLQAQLKEATQQAESLIQSSPSAFGTQMVKKQALLKADVIANLLKLSWHPEPTSWKELESLSSQLHRPSWGQVLNFCQGITDPKEVFGCIRERLPEIDLATTDTALHQLFKDGIVEPCLMISVAKKAFSKESPKPAPSCKP